MTSATSTIRRLSAGRVRSRLAGREHLVAERPPQELPARVPRQRLLEHEHLRGHLERREVRRDVPPEVLGPHLTLVDLVPDVVSPLRRQAMGAGSLTFNRRDVEAYRLELGLSQVLGGPVGIEPIMTLFHAL